MNSLFLLFLSEPMTLVACINKLPSTCHPTNNSNDEMRPQSRIKLVINNGTSRRAVRELQNIIPVVNVRMFLLHFLPGYFELVEMALNWEDSTASMRFSLPLHSSKKTQLLPAEAQILTQVNHRLSGHHKTKL